MLKIRSRKFVVVLAAILVAVGAPLAYLRFSPKARQARLLDRAEQNFKQAEYDRARLEYMGVLRSEPQNAIAIRNLGIVWFEQGNPTQALPLLARANATTPGDLEVKRRLASALATAGYPGDARKEARSILQLDPANPEALLLFVDASFTEADTKEAEAYLEKLPDKTGLGYFLAQANLAHRKGDTANAEAALLKAIAVAPNSSIAHAALGEIYRQQREVAKLEEALKQASASAPLRSIFRLKYAEYKMRTGALAEAETLAKAEGEKAVDYLPAWLLQAEIALARKKLEDSKRLLENVFVRDPRNAEARLLMAQIELAAGNPAKAVSALEEIGHELPRSVAAKFQLGRAYQQSGNPAKAAQALTQVLASNPNHLEALLLLAEVNLSLGASSKVVSSMEQLLKRTPKLAPAQLILAEALRREGRLEDAAKIFKDQLEANAKNASSQYLLGMILRQQKKFPEAREAFQLAEDAAPENPLSTSQLVELDLAEKKYAEALARVERLQQRAPKSGAPNFLKGRIYAAQGAWDKAESALLQALADNPNSPAPYQLLVSVYLRNRKANEAVAQMEARLVKEPGDLQSRLLLAMLLEQQKQFPKARAAYEKLLELRPDFVPAMNNLAYLYSEQFNLLDQAQEIALKARAAKVDDEIERAKIADTLGWIYFRRGEFSAALPLLEEAAQKLQEYPEVRFHVGMAKYMAGQSDEARTIFTELAASKAEFPGKADVVPRLKLLGQSPGESSQFPLAEIEALVAQSPSDPLAQLRLGEALERAGDEARAVAAYEAALKANPKFVPALVNAARLQALKNPAKAMELLKSARALSLADPALAVTLGQIAFKAADFPWAYSVLQSVSDQIQTNPRALVTLAWASYSLGKVDEARDGMERILKSSPESPEAAVAKTFLSTTALLRTPVASAEASAEIERQLAGDPEYVPALLVKGAAAVQRKDYATAKQMYQKALAKYPAFAPAKTELAAVYVEKKSDLDRALELATDAQRSAPEDVRAAMVLGDVRFARKEFAEALKAWQRGAKDVPLDATRLYHSGLSFLAEKNPVKARRAIEEALAAGLPEALRPEAEKALAELPK